MTVGRRIRASVAGAASLAAEGCLAAAFVAAAAILQGCGGSGRAPAPAPAPAVETAAPSAPTPAIRLRVASLDVSGFGGRIERKHVEELSRLIGSKKIEVLALQGVTRYPSVKTRTDLVGELASAAGMRQAFGETINLSGRQSGNALLSSYPIASNDALSYEGISGSNFEGALRVVVDAGARPIVVVSTRLPEPLTAGDERICAGVISRLESERGEDPLVVLGNLPPAPDGWKEFSPAGKEAGSLWYTPGPVSAAGGSTGRCALGTLLIADMDIFPQGKR